MLSHTSSSDLPCWGGGANYSPLSCGWHAAAFTARILRWEMGGGQSRRGLGPSGFAPLSVKKLIFDWGGIKMSPPYAPRDFQNASRNTGRTRRDFQGTRKDAQGTQHRTSNGPQATPKDPRVKDLQLKPNTIRP